jgi:hypothetical protein
MRYARGRVPRSRLLPLLVAGLSLAYFLSYPLAIGRADESHLLYGARRILEGQVLYRDFFEGITPLAFYLFAGVYRVAGTTLLAARVTMAAIEAIGCALLFALVRRVAGLAEAVLAALIFAGLCIPAWPYASAHWLTTVLGLAIAAVTLSTRWAGSSRLRPALAGVIGGVAVCVQQQRGAFLALWLPLALGVLALGVPRPARRRALAGQLAWAAGGGVVVVALVLGHAAWAASPAALVEMLFAFAVRRYAPAQSGRQAWAAIQPLTQPWALSTWIWLLRVAPLALVGEGLRLGLARRTRPWSLAERERACLWMLGVAMAASVLYLPDFIHVGFVLPFLVIPAASLVHGARTAPVWSRFPAGRRLVTAVVWGLAAAVVGEASANIAYARAIAPVRLVTAFGELRVEPNVARLFHAVRRHLHAETDGRALLYSYPDDAWLYLALPADDATRFSVLVAGFFPDEYVEEVLATLRARRPRTVVLALPFTPEAVQRVVAEGYEPVEDVWAYRVFVRRRPPGEAA